MSNKGKNNPFGRIIAAADHEETFLAKRDETRHFIYQANKQRRKLEGKRILSDKTAIVEKYYD